LSIRNVVVGLNQSNSKLNTIAIDFDGFGHPSVPPLPRKLGETTIRTFGHPGFRHPDNIRAVLADTSEKDDSIMIMNDRFSLAALCCEIMSWSDRLGANLNRTTLLSEEDLRDRKLVVPDQLRVDWKEGYDLLEEAINETQDKLPNPERWLKALGFIGGGRASVSNSWASTAILHISKQSGNNPRRLVQTATFTNPNGGSGTFGAIDKVLSKITYKYSMDRVKIGNYKLKFSWRYPVILDRDGEHINLGECKDEIEIGPKDIIRSNGWVFEFVDGSIGSK